MRDYLKNIEKNCVYFNSNEDMARHCTFKCGGRAKFFCVPKNLRSFIKVLRYCNLEGLKVFVLGNGSNTLFKDFNGIVISTQNLDKIKIKNKVLAQCGVEFSKLSQLCLKNSLTGFEFATGIPASVGGGVYNNAGAFGGEISQIIDKVRLFDGKKCFWLNREEMDFGYRKSIVQKDGLYVLEVVFCLEKGDNKKIQATMLDILQKRKAKQPLNFPSAGSVFKRQGEIIPAKVIDKLGLKGFNINDAQISEKHAGFIINKKNASVYDIEKLIELTKQKVFEKEGIILEQEIEIVGD